MSVQLLVTTTSGQSNYYRAKGESQVTGVKSDKVCISSFPCETHKSVAFLLSTTVPHP